MLDFYHQARYKKESRPSILGLSASPSMSSKESDLDMLEQTLDAKCVTPTLHRKDLLKWVNKPKIEVVEYETVLEPTMTSAMSSLQSVYHSMRITEDPAVLKLAASTTDRSHRELEKAVTKHSTYSQDQVKGLQRGSLEISRELGTWAVDRYLHRTITEYIDQAESSNSFFDKWQDDERRYLSNTLRKVALEPPPESPQGGQVSLKARHLIRELMSADDTPVAIVFARERATVGMLFDLLTATPAIRERFRIGAVVGTSNYQTRKKAIYEPLNNIDLLVLQKFRSGQLNLLIATNVLEEGIDVPACNLVICFDQPATLKSFVQRRGRARVRNSKLVLFLAKSLGMSNQWDAMEEEMRRLYQDEERARQRLEVLENMEEISSTCFVVPSTGARLDFDNAKPHLNHFCRSLSPGEFVDARPDYIISYDQEATEPILAVTVILPSYIPHHVRTASNKFAWKSEANATSDAAFHAYLALYRSGLISDNLLPFDREQIPGLESRAAFERVESAYLPWKEVAQTWEHGHERFAYTFTFHNELGDASGQYDVVLPLEIHQPRPIQLFLEDGVVWGLRSTAGRRVTRQEADEVIDQTSALLAHHFGHRWPVLDKAHVVKMAARGADITLDKIGSRSFAEAFAQVQDQGVLLRDKNNTPFLFQELLPAKPPAEDVQHLFYEFEKAPEDVPYVALKKWTRRVDFLHPILSDANQKRSSKPYAYVLPVPLVTADAVPIEHVRFGMVVPCLIHELEVMLVARHLAITLLAPLDITDIYLVRAAISSRSAAEPYQYERLELLGDSVLKFCAAIRAASLHPEWPEGYLSYFKDSLISNARLSRATIETGLAKYILYDRFTAKQWRPLYLDDNLAEEAEELRRERPLSTKVLADVVEALIGAAYCDGGLPKASTCIGLFVHEQDWSNVDDQRTVLYDDKSYDNPHSLILDPLEDIIGYKFTKQGLLVEAMTHASFVSHGGGRSLERLEFIGDAVLDQIIVTRLFAASPPLPHDRMHTLKTALVNGDFLAFLSMENGLSSVEAIVTEDTTLASKDVFTPIWSFMRHASVAIGLEQAAAANKHKELRGAILEALENGHYYPWDLLARIQARKFFSDLMEALLGAVWIDSGSIDVCQAIVERMGMLTYLDRILRDGVQAQHPKELVGMYAGNKTVRYEVDILEKEDREREFFCTLHIGDRAVTRVGEGLSKEEVQVKAATEAIRILDAERDAMLVD